jgi:signal recognition particle subunit SEC65
MCLCNVGDTYVRSPSPGRLLGHKNIIRNFKVNELRNAYEKYNYKVISLY